MGILHWALQTTAWFMITLGGCYLAYQAGRRKECGIWERWYERQQAIEAHDRQREQSKRSVTLTTVQFRRD